MKQLKRILMFLFMMILIINTLDFTGLTVQAASNVIETTVDVNSSFTGLDHTHLWSFYYDDVYHWQQCDICGLINNKHEHVLTENNGSKEYCCDTNGKAFKYVCTCGYTTISLTSFVVSSLVNSSGHWQNSNTLLIKLHFAQMQH